MQSYATMCRKYSLTKSWKLSRHSRIFVLQLQNNKKQFMKLTQTAIEKIKPREVVLALALALEFTELWINKLISVNKDNSPLTTYTALQVIKEKTGLSEDEILEPVSANIITE